MGAGGTGIRWNAIGSGESFLFPKSAYQRGGLATWVGKPYCKTDPFYDVPALWPPNKEDSQLAAFREVPRRGPSRFTDLTYGTVRKTTMISIDFDEFH